MMNAKGIENKKGLCIRNVTVLGMAESLIAAAYPMRAELPKYFKREATEEEIFNYEKAAIDLTLGGMVDESGDDLGLQFLKRGQRLARAGSGSGHDCFLKGIVVQYDLTAPEYFWRQFDRYHFHDYISSSGRVQ